MLLKRLKRTAQPGGPVVRSNETNMNLRRGQIALCGLVLSGCAAHEVYDRPGLDLAAARVDWMACQRTALDQTGAHDSAGLGDASIRGSHLVAEVARDPEEHDVAGYKIADWARISRRRQLRQACMTSKGYHFLGVPATERL